jgi:hypothetical protein
MIDYQAIADDAAVAADRLHSNARNAAQSQGLRIYSRGFEFLSLDANGERDENVIDYCERYELDATTVEAMAAECRKAGSAFLAIGYGVDAAETRGAYECGDYEPMYDWIDLPNIALS